MRTKLVGIVGREISPDALFRTTECTPLYLLARAGLQPHPSHFDPENGDRTYFRDINKATYLYTVQRSKTIICFLI